MDQTPSRSVPDFRALGVPLSSVKKVALTLQPSKAAAQKALTKTRQAINSPIKMLAPLSVFPIKASRKPDPEPEASPRRMTLLDGLSLNPNGRIPNIHVQRASGGIEDPLIIDWATAKWKCCACNTSNHVYLHPGQHPLGALACDCPHKPCSTCTTTGNVKPFLPIEEPAMVPCNDADEIGVPTAESEEKAKELRFGIVCPCCGLSWRAREFGKRFSKTLRKMPSMSLNQAVRMAPVESRLRKSRSTMVLGNKRIITPPGQELPKQAEYMAVRFSGITCTCGTLLSLKMAFCFQIIGDEIDEREKEFRTLWEEKRAMAPVGWSTEPELQEKGHGTSILTLCGSVQHENPLRSCPVIDKMAEDEWTQKCDKENWV